ARRLDAAEQGYGLLQAFQLAPALRAALEVGGHLSPLVRGERPVEESGERFARVVMGHGRKRSSLSFRSARARCRRERTVPSSSSSASAISSYERPSRSRSTTTMRRSSGSSAIARC